MSHNPEKGYDKDQTKIVTIKGVDSHLYTQFSELANLTAARSGAVFSHILAHYLRNIKPIIPVVSNRRILGPGSNITYEVIVNQNELIISQKDFESVKMNIQFIFMNIRLLTFDKTVDTKSLMENVHSIYDSEVETLGKVSKLILLSINRSDTEGLQISSDTKDVTIRNVNASIYEEFTALCHREQVTVGDGMNKMLSSMIPHLEIVEIITRFVQPKIQFPIVISLRPQVVVKANDLEELGENKVVFHRIKNLQFDVDIPDDLFTNSILGIYNCDNVIFPKNLPKLLKLSKQQTYP